MPYGGVGNTGDGLRMAWMLGAGLADIGHVAGTYGQHADTTDDEHELLTANYLGAILVNARGERFADESESYKVLGSAVLGQPGRMAYQVFDSVVRARSKPGVPLSDMERIEELGHLVSAPTIAALEHKLGIPAGRLERTVAAVQRERVGSSCRRVRPDRPRERRRDARARRDGAVLRVPRGDRDDLDVRRPQRRARRLGQARRRDPHRRASMPPARSSEASTAPRT